MRWILLTFGLLSLPAVAAERSAKESVAPAVRYLCAWSTRTVTYVNANSTEAATEACKAAPPAKGATLVLTRAPDKNGKHGDILIDGVPIDYD